MLPNPSFHRTLRIKPRKAGEFKRYASFTYPLPRRYLPDSPKYKAVGALGVDLGLEWGGNWKTIVDQPHFQRRPAWATGLSEKQMLAGLRSRKDTGQPVYA